MSRFSGKHDFYDRVASYYTLEEIQNNVKIFIGKNDKPLKIEKMTDLIPYYPYLISLGAYDNVDRKATVHLTSKSYIDLREQDSLDFVLKQILRYYNSCKRKKIDFSVDGAVKKVFAISDKDRDTVATELANRVKINGKKASTDGLHLSIYDFYRRELAEEMIKNGLNPADYGYERFK